MKVINARTGTLQSIPFTLGSAGRGRKGVEITFSARIGQGPVGPEDVGYHKEGASLLLTKGFGQEGILLRINTTGTYTRAANEGKVVLRGGQATLLAQGYCADGDAGGLGSQADELWHVEGPALFVATLQGGSYKGYGPRYLVVTRSFRVAMLRREELCQMIATDDDPEVSELIRQYADQLHEDVQAAVALADKLDALIGVPVVALDVKHFTRWRSAEVAVKEWGIALPVAMGEMIGGIDALVANTLVPGEKSLVDLVVGPGGGKRYSFETFSEEGLTHLKRESDHSNRNTLSLVESADWHSAWLEYKDGRITAYVLADAGGVHYYDPDQHHQGVMTREWRGVVAQPPSVAAIRQFFRLDPPQSAMVEAEPISDPFDALKKQFGS